MIYFWVYASTQNSSILYTRRRNSVSIYKISKKGSEDYSGAIIGGEFSKFEAFSIFNKKCNFGDDNIFEQFDIEEFQDLQKVLEKIDCPVLAPRYKKMSPKSSEAKILILQWYKGWIK
jgi:hypothetical protein